jgi:NitT/TauT family transport system substrate-binding protein
MSPQTKTAITRRQAIAGIGSFAATAASIGILVPARATTKVRFLTSWFAQAEHGGYYQAKATGIYDKAGLDVTIIQGGPQVNNAQLLTGGDADLMMGWDIQTMSAVERGVPMVAVASSFQFDLQGLVAHPTVDSISDLKGHPILLATSSHTTWWPWLKERFGFTDDQAQPYNFTYQRFQSDPTVAQQGYITYDSFALQKSDIPAKFFLLAADGYPSYGSPTITTRPFIDNNKDVVARFVRASAEGWKSYLKNPAPANVLIKADNPKMGDDQIAFSVDKIRSSKAITGGDAATMGIGTMTDARWHKTRDFLVRAQLLKDSTDWRSAYTTEFCHGMGITA